MTEWPGSKNVDDRLRRGVDDHDVAGIVGIRAIKRRDIGPCPVVREINATRMRRTSYTVLQGNRRYRIRLGVNDSDKWIGKVRDIQDFRRGRAVWSREQTEERHHDEWSA